MLPKVKLSANFAGFKMMRGMNIIAMKIMSAPAAKVIRKRMIRCVHVKFITSLISYSRGSATESEHEQDKQEDIR